jgi:serine/threonine protein kinase
MKQRGSEHPKEVKDYLITAELGHGSFSTVCKAFHRPSRRNYAIKILPISNLLEPQNTERLQREVNSMAHLRHENLVSLHDFFWDETNFYLVLDLCSGGALFDYIINHDKLSEPLSALIFRQVAEGIRYCHSMGVAHRDLKPENVLIDRFPHVKVSDFGLCGFVHPDAMMTTFCGSPLYCAPECLAKQKYSGPASDVWSLGVLLYSMVTGDRPWTSSNFAQLVNEIMMARYTLPDWLSENCRDLIGKMMRAMPEQRITIEEVLAHPWMELGQQGPALPKLPLLKKEEFPPEGMSMEQIQQAVRERATLSKHGVYSPFRDLSEGAEERREAIKEARRTSLPKVYINNALLLAGNAKPDSSREEISGSRLSVTRLRQSLHSPHSRTPSPLPRLH